MQIIRVPIWLYSFHIHVMFKNASQILLRIRFHPFFVWLSACVSYSSTPPPPTSFYDRNVRNGPQKNQQNETRRRILAFRRIFQLKKDEIFLFFLMMATSQIYKKK